MLLKRKNSKAGFALGPRGRAKSQKTFIVLGAPRGGTSLVAGALRLAGVAMGDDIDPANNEDRAFNFHDGNMSTWSVEFSNTDYLAKIRNVIRARNDSHAVWGWKDPLAALYVSDVLSDLVNPQFILITRDITANIMRERIEVSDSVRKADEGKLYLAKAEQALDLYRAAFALVQRTNAPTLFVSYDKACRNPEDFSRQLLDFISVPSPASSKAMIEAITLFTREGAMSADLSHRPIAVGWAASGDLTLSGFSDLSAVYHRCATLINLQHYEAGLALAKRVLAQAVVDFESFPHLKNNPVVLAEVEAGMCFMSAIAQINLGNGTASYLALGRFSAIARYLRLAGQKSKLVEELTREATRLFDRLERELAT